MGNNRFPSFLPTSSEWIGLDFSNTELPDKFDVKNVNFGRSWGEWFAIGIREQ